MAYIVYVTSGGQQRLQTVSATSRRLSTEGINSIPRQGNLLTLLCISWERESPVLRICGRDIEVALSRHEGRQTSRPNPSAICSIAV